MHGDHQTEKDFCSSVMVGKQAAEFSFVDSLK